MLFSKLATSLFLASIAFAADNLCSTQVNATSQSDLDAIASCETFSADITIGGDIVSANIGGVQTLNGSLIVNNATSLGSLSAPVLQSIGDSFTLHSLTVLGTLNFPLLTAVGTIDWVTLPALSGLSFGAGVSNATDIGISDTALTSLTGINIVKVGVFNINNNKYLKEVNLALKTVTNSLDISFNGQSVSASFPSLVWAYNMTFRDVGTISAPNITAVNSSLGFINNTVESLSFPKLATIGASLSFVSNSELTNISFPALTTIGGGFQIANNTELNKINGFPKVSEISGAIDFTGNFTEAELPSLDLVKGGVDVESSSSAFNCSSFNEAQSDGNIQGDSYVCKGASVSTSAAPSGTKTSSSGSSSTGSASAETTSTSSGIAAILTTEYSSTLFGVMAAFIWQFV